MLLEWKRSDFQQAQEFRARHEQFPTKSTTRAKLPALNQSINAEVIHAEKVSGFLHRVGEPLLFDDFRKT